MSVMNSVKQYPWQNMGYRGQRVARQDPMSPRRNDSLLALVDNGPVSFLLSQCWHTPARLPGGREAAAALELACAEVHRSQLVPIKLLESVFSAVIRHLWHSIWSSCFPLLAAEPHLAPLQAANAGMIHLYTVPTCPQFATSMRRHRFAPLYRAL